MTADRAADELTLRMVRLRASGRAVAWIAAKLNLTQQYVSTTTNRVMRADAKDSGEDIAGAYWDVGQRGGSVR